MEHWIKDCTDPRKRDKSEITNRETTTKKNIDKKNTVGYISRAVDNNVEISENISLFCNETDRKENDLWILDSGCNKHITRSMEYYASFEKFYTPKTVKIGNNSEVPAYGQGRIYIEMTVKEKKIFSHIDNVWYGMCRILLLINFQWVHV